MGRKCLLSLLVLLSVYGCGPGKKKSSPDLPEAVAPGEMQAVYEKISTPYKYGLVMIPPDPSKKFDCPSVFRKGDRWYMTYLVYDGRGYETWLAVSMDLLSWDPVGSIMSFSDTTDWDDDQKAGYIALQEMEWGGGYKWQKYRGKYWMSYFGGRSKGYEAGVLSIGIAFTEEDPTSGHEWQRLGKPVLTPNDPDVRWWENSTMYKSSVIWDRRKLTGHPFVMYYNARGDSLRPQRGAERIGMAVSDDMVHWQRYGDNPVINHHRGISGDAVIQKIDDVYVMFYFGAFWEGRPNAFNRFACSHDLVHWTDWDGPDLISPGESYDAVFAHKSSVIKYEGTVYHFYCAVNREDDRGIALATSVDLGKSNMEFNSAGRKMAVIQNR
jgi:predicted GH43/DUF377 family glycosyl hydrolase